MGSGFTEIGLVLFTTLAPAGGIAFVVVALVALLGAGTTGREDHFKHLSHFIIVPLSIAIIGLIASATQLGTPANALNAFNGLGRSPLSNEVTCSVLFLALAGVYWLTSYYDRVPSSLAHAWLALAALSALLMVYGISAAYSIGTIPTWDTPYVPVNLWLVGVTGGTVLGVATLCLAGATRKPRLLMVLLICGTLALVVETACCALQDVNLSEYANGVVQATSLVPAYPVLIVLFAVCGCVGIAGMSFTLRRRLPGLDVRAKVVVCLFAALVFVGIFLVRFAFYGLHMTTGL